ncbi:MAG: DUF2007 domain-containing protein [Clostridia bacterium]|nr:DUF2007 domain-containing protein [Clostridia bacterium]
MEGKQEEIEIQLFSTSNEYEINQICSILTENNIPFIRKNDGSGSYMNLYMGQSIQEKRIFVNKKDYDKSIELISSYISNEIDVEEDISEEKQVDNDSSSNKYTLIRRSLGFLVLGMPILAIILVIIMSLIHN